MTFLKRLPLVIACLSCSSMALASGVDANEPLWGDTHVHTSYSFDSYMFGNFSADPKTAFRWAKGIPVLHPATGAQVRLDRPLDFLVVADHSESALNDNRVTSHPVGAQAFKLLKEGKLHEAFMALLAIFKSDDKEERDSLAKPEVIASNWSDEVNAAEEANEPGRFTAFSGWEWTSHPMAAICIVSSLRTLPEKRLRELSLLPLLTAIVPKTSGHGLTRRRHQLPTNSSRSRTTRMCRAV